MKIGRTVIFPCGLLLSVVRRAAPKGDSPVGGLEGHIR